MVDQARGELYARVFDVSADVVVPSQKREIRFPITVGVAGNVASTGKVLLCDMLSVKASELSTDNEHPRRLQEPILQSRSRQADRYDD